MEGTIGEVRLFAGNFAPKAWAFCSGQIIQIAQNTALFSILGTTYGGNGTTTFRLPDLRGRIAVGAGHGPGLMYYSLGTMSGSNSATVTNSQMPAHTHNVSLQSMSVTVTAPYLGDEGTQTSPVNNFPAITASKPYTDDVTDAAMGAQALTFKGTITQVTVTGSNQPHNNVQPSTVMNYVICMYGIFPARN